MNTLLKDKPTMKLIGATRNLFLFSLLFLLLSWTGNAQEIFSELKPNQFVTFSLVPDEIKIFTFHSRQDTPAEISWLANDNVTLEFAVFDSSGKAVEIGSSYDFDSTLFIVPNEGTYRFLLKYVKSEENLGRQNISLELKDSYKLPARAKQKELRVAAGYTVKIHNISGTDLEHGQSIVTFEKAGRLKKIIRGGGTDYTGFSFPDSLPAKASPESRKSANLIKGTPDKTGDGVPDIMIDYFSGGAHCCFSTYFVNLGEIPVTAEIINTENTGLNVIGKNPKGGLRFLSNENNFAYWNIHFAGSPLPQVILEFENGELHPNFELMKKAPPGLVTLKQKARLARLKISNAPYTQDGDDFHEAFWSEMLDLIYTGNEPLAWQYFDLVWPASKPGKERFLSDFKSQLENSYYGSRRINTSNSFQNFEKALIKTLEKIK